MRNEEKIKYYNFLSSWCKKNKLFVRTNKEVFFISERVSMKPNFLINENVYIDFLNDDDLTEKYLYNCGLFSKSYGILIIIPKSCYEELNNYTKKDFENKFNFKF